MKKLIIGVLVILVISSNVFGQMAGSLSEITFIGPVTGKPVSFSLYLPDDYLSSDFAYPVVYHLHGLGDYYLSNSRPAVIHSFERAMELGFIDDVIIVFPDGYGNSMWGNSIDGTKPAETNIIEEIIPYIDANFRTIPDREHRLIQGFSMGGFGAAKFIAKFPNMFCRAIVYDGGLRTWKTLQSGRPQIASEVFSFSEQHFVEYSPWKYLRENASILSIDTLLYVPVGDFVSFNNTFFDTLNYYGIPFKTVNGYCGHDLECFLEREWINAAEFYEPCLNVNSDIEVNHIKPSELSLSPNPAGEALSINYSISKVGKVLIDIIDMTGNHVCNVIDAYRTTGNHRINLNLADIGISRGTYYVTLISPEGKKIQTLIALK